MRKILSAIVLMFAMATPALAGNTAQTASTAEGKHYNDVFKNWQRQSFTIYCDDDGGLYVKAETGLGQARGYVAKRDVSRFIEAVKKAREWVDVAKANKADTTKLVGDFRYASDIDQAGVRLVFFSASAGAQTDLIMEVIDFDNEFYKTELYIEPDQIDKFLAMLAEYDGLVAQAKKKSSDADLFK